MAATDTTGNFWVVIPAYCEEGTIEGVVSSLKKRFEHVVVVDDGSADETSSRAHRAGATVLRHPINCGQGASLQTGIEYVCRRNAKYVATFDADGQHDPEDLIRMLHVLLEEKCDIVLGSRFLGNTESIPTARKALLRLAVFWTWVTVGIRLTDAHNGLRVMTGDTARKLNIQQSRMAHASEIIDIIHTEKFTFREVPVEISYTEYSMAKGQRWWNLFDILKELLMGRLMK